MAGGHGWTRHGRELRSPSPERYETRVRTHLRRATVAIVSTDPHGRRSYLLADPARNQVAWIAPHKEHRSTFFQPRKGVERYVRRQRAFGSSRTVDLTAARREAARQATAARREAARQAARSVASVQRGTRRHGRER